MTSHFLHFIYPEDKTAQVPALFPHKLMTRAMPSSFYYSDVLLGIMVQPLLLHVNILLFTPTSSLPLQNNIGVTDGRRLNHSAMPGYVALFGHTEINGSFLLYCYL